MTSGMELQVGHNPATSWHCWDPTHTLINAYWISKRKAQKWEKWTGTSQIYYAESPWWIECAIPILRANSLTCSVFLQAHLANFQRPKCCNKLLHRHHRHHQSSIFIPFQQYSGPVLSSSIIAFFPISPTRPLLAVLCIPCPTRLPHPEAKTW